MSEAAWDKAFTQGSTALKNRLMKVHANNPKFQTWLKSSGHGAGASVKQASKEVKPSERVKKLQVKSLQAYGATKGLKVGGEHGSGEMKDTIAPLTRDQHSKVQAAARAAKAAEKPAAAKKTPLTKAQRMAAIAAAVRKAQTKHDVPTMDPDDESHDDLRDLHQSLHIRKGYNEDVSLDEGKMKDVVTDRQETERLKAQEVLGGPVKSKASAIGGAGQPKNLRNLTTRLAARAMKAGHSVSEGYEYTNIGHAPEHSIDDDPQPAADPLKLTTTRKKPVQFKSGMRNGVKTESTEESQMKKGRMLALAVMKKNQLKHPIAQQMGEEIKDEADVGEYDYEGDMAKSQLRSILAHAKRLHDMLEDQTNLPEWVQSKITLAQDYILTAADYMEGEMNEGYGGKFPKQWQKEMEKVPSTSTVVHKDKTVVTTKKDGKVVDVKTTKNEEVEQIDELDRKTRVSYLKKSLTQLNNIASSRHTTGNKTYGSKTVGKRLAGLSRLERNSNHPASVRDNIDKARAQFEEVEQVTEAEGTVAVTPKEKELAAHHGDKSRITYGDVLKARLKSAAEKAMKKGN